MAYFSEVMAQAPWTTLDDSFEWNKGDGGARLTKQLRAAGYAGKVLGEPQITGYGGESGSTPEYGPAGIAPELQTWMNANGFKMQGRYEGNTSYMALAKNDGTIVGEVNKFVDKPSGFETLVKTGLLGAAGYGAFSALSGLAGAGAGAGVSGGFSAGAVDSAALGLDAGLAGGSGSASSLGASSLGAAGLGAGEGAAQLAAYSAANPLTAAGVTAATLPAAGLPGLGTTLGAGALATTGVNAMRAGEIAGYATDGTLPSSAAVATGVGGLSGLLGNVGSGLGSLASGALTGLGTAGGLGSLASVLSGLYGMKLSDDAREASDPFAPYRAGYAKQLAALEANPGTITSRPGFQAGLETIGRKSAATGYYGSGNMASALSRYSGDFYNQEAGRLAQLAGAGTTPGNGQALGANLASQSLGSIGYGLGPLLAQLARGG